MWVFSAPPAGRLETYYQKGQWRIRIKEINLKPCQSTVQRLIRSFESIRFEHTSRAQNRHVDVLTKLVSKIDVPGEVIDVSIIKSALRATVADLGPNVVTDEQNWRVPIM